MIEQIFGYSIYLGLALTLAAVSTLGLGIMLHAGTRVRNEPLPLLLWELLQRSWRRRSPLAVLSLPEWG